MSFTKSHALDTSKKLKTRPRKQNLPRLEVREVRDGPHLIQQIWCNGRFVNQFGIKHASRRDNSHGWVARDLELSPHRMYEFAICQMTVDEMIEHFAARGFLELPETFLL